MALLISPRELDKQTRDVIIFDCRADLMDKTLGRRQFAEGHIPGALFLDLESDLASAPGAGGRHPLPDRDELSDKLRARGVDSSTHIVCYDQNNGAFAARLWWLVRWLGHENVSVLDGGVDAWIADGYTLSQDEESFTTGNFKSRPPLTKTVNAEDLVSSSGHLTDAREPRRFRGEFEPVDPVAGHIPGAMNLPFAENMTAGRFCTPQALRNHFESQGLTQEDSIICYCGSGVTATHNILALLLAGYEEPALYPGSFSEWITDPTRPVAKD